MARNEITIPVFDGENYPMWKKRITVYLKFKNCEEVITREKIVNDKPDWDENNLRAINYIYSAISDKQLEFVCEENTAYGIMKKFDEMYSKESTALQIIYRNKLERIKLKDYSDSAAFFSEFEKSVNELKGAGAKVSEKEKLNYMLNTLPENYSYIGDLIDAMKEEDQTVEYVKNKIQMSEMKSNKEENAVKKSNVFAAEFKKKRQDQVCYNCGKAGHTKKECYHGGQAAHGEQWRRGQQTRGRGNTGRGNYGRGRSNFRGNPGGYRTYQQQDINKPGPSAWVTMVECSVASNNNRENRLGKYQINWLLDSGCTDHIINNEDYFDKCVELKKPVNVYLGNKSVVKATKVGTVIRQAKI